MNQHRRSHIIPKQPAVFTVRERDHISARILEIARSERQIIAGAIVGSLARDKGDRWSDLDLSFAITPEGQTLDVLNRITAQLRIEFGATHLFDLPSGFTTFRVLLLQGCLQVDLSVTPASHFGADGPDFKLLFGSSVDKPLAQPPSAEHLVGYAAHHAVRARFCIERSRLWQAEYWISAMRDYTLSLACLRNNLPSMYGRGFDQLSADIHAQAREALVKSLDRVELLRALSSAIHNLRIEARHILDDPAQLETQLHLLTLPWDE